MKMSSGMQAVSMNESRQQGVAARASGFVFMRGDSRSLHYAAAPLRSGMTNIWWARL
jgi:hypothetical protein